MSIITFWNSGKEETGKTLSIAAIATYMAMMHNYKVLVISTGYKEKTLNRCFFGEENKAKIKKNLGLFGPNTNVGMEEGIDGIEKVLRANKMTPENIKNYTKAVFNEVFEILPGSKLGKKEYEKIRIVYPDIINLANSYYDLVFVDLSKELGEEITEKILGMSNLIVATIGQGLSNINEFLEVREEKPILKSQKALILIGKYDQNSKYTVKNISRYMHEKNKVLTVPYNTLFFEASQEMMVPDLLLKLKKVDKDDINAIFMSEIARASDNIIYRLQDLASKI